MRQSSVLDQSEMCALYWNYHFTIYLSQRRTRTQIAASLADGG